MSEDVKTAIIAGGVALVVAIITSIITLVSNKKMLGQLQYESKRVGITEKRMNWIMEVRNLFAELFSFDFSDFYRTEQKYKPFNKNIQLIKLYMNFGGKVDKEILNLIEQLHENVYTASHYPESHLPDYKDLEGTYERVIEDLQKYIRVYLKSEWNRVKFDSDPLNDKHIFNEEEEIAKLSKIYDNTSDYIEAEPEREAQYVRELIKGMK